MLCAGSMSEIEFNAMSFVNQNFTLYAKIQVVSDTFVYYQPY